MKMNTIKKTIRRLKVSSTLGLKNGRDLVWAVSLNKPGYTVAKYLLLRNDLKVESVGNGVIKITGVI